MDRIKKPLASSRLLIPNFIEVQIQKPGNFAPPKTDKAEMKVLAGIFLRPLMA
jgi:hypothetical protein